MSATEKIKKQIVDQLAKIRDECISLKTQVKESRSRIQSLEEELKKGDQQILELAQKNKNANSEAFEKAFDEHLGKIFEGISSFNQDLEIQGLQKLVDDTRKNLDLESIRYGDMQKRQQQIQNQITELSSKKTLSYEGLNPAKGVEQQINTFLGSLVEYLNGDEGAIPPEVPSLDDDDDDASSYASAEEGGMSRRSSMSSVSGVGGSAQDVRVFMQQALNL